ncbi:uncharacterized protein LOC6527160 [Drosophila yakuba]|uniref:Matrin-type domain-containing protein n=1 Tax=Drosophila yakuba TaxID=7245 RepID=B4P0S1_DROYA|nr:uncharacterized protein LOC6527160 [Drosophila yakuba]EDW87966.1 uncharacterized protein Dyak_GE18477 [Drosophila yakuba]
MLSHRFNMHPQRRLPVIHEEIAKQCALNIVRVASAMPQPQPRCPSGHVVVLVELRRADEPTVYRYQVNVPPTGWPSEDLEEGDQRCQQLVLPGTLETMGLKLPQPERFPYPMHGRSIMEMGWSPKSSTGPSPMLMMQSAVHVIDGQNSPTDFTTFSEPVVTCESPDNMRAHFMASLYQQQPSPLSYSDIWVPEGPPEGLPRSVSTAPFPQLCLGENYEGMVANRIRPINGYQAASKPIVRNPRHVAELCLNSNGEYVLNEQLHRPLISCHPNPIAPSVVRREQHYFFQHQSHQVESSFKGLNGYVSDLSGNGYISQESGKPKNGYKDQPTAFADQRIALHTNLGQGQGYGHASVPGFIPNHLQSRVAMIEPRLCQEAVVKPEKPGLALASEVPAANPQELQSLFRWNYCALCHVVIRSGQNATDHYSSRAHERRISSWLVRQCYANLAGQDGDGNLGGSIGQTDFYCKLCDLRLTSLSHAQQHFFGRRHLMVARHRMRPYGDGFYDREGNWVRTDARYPMCELCDVSITSESQMAMHLAGARHRRRVDIAYAGGCAGGMEMGMGLVPLDGTHMYRINGSSMAPIRPLGLQMLHGTHPLPLNDPCAAFYCEACNITLNHLKSVKQHEQGRMHRRNMNRFSGQPVFYE